MPSIFFTFILGFILGVKHAFEPDHLIAVSTIVSGQKNPLKAALVGTFWGLGHTTTLFIIGILVLLLKLSVPKDLSVIFELFVGIMLVILGIRAIKQRKLTLHTHHHLHFHPLLIGGVHGLAGSGALMLLVLTTLPSLFSGLYYILIFGLGSMVGMSVMSFLLSLPFIFSANKFPGVENILRMIAGTLSILFGLFSLFSLT